jgi:flagellar basal body-associated protein FliL
MEQNSSLKTIIIGVVALVVGLGGGYYFGSASGIEKGVAQERGVQEAKKKEAEKKAAEKANPFQQTTTNPFETSPANPYQNVKVNPFE